MTRSACALLVATLSLPAAADTGFKFHVPAGWSDLSPGVPEATLAKVPPQAAAVARSGRFAALAFDFAGASKVFATNLNVHIQNAPLPINERELANLQSGYEQAARANGGSVRVVEISTRFIQGAKVARMVADATVQGNDLRQLVYLIPGYKQTAAITFTTERSRFDEYVGTFDEAALRTEGARAAPPMLLGIDLAEVGSAGLLGGLIAGGLGLVSALRKRRAQRRLASRSPDDGAFRP